MSQHESKVLWLKDMIEHLAKCQRQLEWSEDPATIALLSQTMLGDLECCRKICIDLQERARMRQVA